MRFIAVPFLAQEDQRANYKIGYFHQGYRLEEI
jgi:hypothetical protein